MRRLRSVVLATMALLLAVAPAMAQNARVSPADATSAVIDGGRVTIYYGRPYTKDPKTGAVRKIWGGVVPFGKMWRMGANEATLLLLQKPIEAGGVTIPAGASTLTFLPMEGGTAKLVVNKQIGQWGGTYDEKQDIGRIDTKAEPLEKAVDQFTISIAKNTAEGATGGVISLMWENTKYSIPFTVKK